MILNLWSEDQEGPVKIYGGRPQAFSFEAGHFWPTNTRKLYRFN